MLIVSRIEDLEKMLKDLNEGEKKAGLNINLEKTKILSRNRETDILLDNQKLEKVEEIVYLGQLVSFEKRTNKEINRRIGITWREFWSLKHIFKGPFSNYHKSQIFNMCIIPSLIYGAQTWSMSKKDEEKIQTA